MAPEPAVSISPPWATEDRESAVPARFDPEDQALICSAPHYRCPTCRALTLEIGVKHSTTLWFRCVSPACPDRDLKRDPEELAEIRPP
jgi:hypothetical protein